MKNTAFNRGGDGMKIIKKMIRTYLCHYHMARMELCLGEFNKTSSSKMQMWYLKAYLESLLKIIKAETSLL